MKPIESLLQVLLGYSYRYANELELQDGVQDVLKQAGYTFRREYIAGQDRIDFLVNADGVTVALECKIKGGPTTVLEQLLRYANQPEIDSVLLVTSRHTHRFNCDTLNDKPFMIAWIAGKI